MVMVKHSNCSGLVALATAASLLAFGCNNTLETDSTGSLTNDSGKQDSPASVQISWKAPSSWRSPASPSEPPRNF